MRKKLLKIGVLAAFSLTGAVLATEYRSPWLSEMGPIRYRMEKLNRDKWSLDMWTSVYTKKADKAFIKQGTKVKPLTELYFGKSDFYIGDIIDVSSADYRDIYWKAENHNPYVYATKLHPRVSYDEKGINVGGRWEYPVYKQKGRIGLRANVPFRNVRIERDNAAEENAAALEGSVLYNSTRTYAEGENFQPDGIPNIGGTAISATAFNATLLRNLVGSYVDGYKQYLHYDATDGFLRLGSAKPSSSNWGIPIHYKANGELPNHEVGAYDSNNYVLFNDFTTDPWDPTTLPENGSGLASRTVYEASDALDYGASFPESAWHNVWFATGHDDVGSVKPNSQTFVNEVNELLRAYGDIDSWLAARGFQFQTDERVGLGDIQLDLFYEHTFSKHWVGEIFFGVQMPAAGANKYSYTPYRAPLGNGNHWVLEVGAMADWQPLNWMNIKLDLRGGFALEAKESRAASFKGGSIKNIGPKADANADWQTFTGRLDFNFFHPKTKDLCSTLGYEFYYKTKDHIKFKNSTLSGSGYNAANWFGQTWGGASFNTAFPLTLSNSVARMHTEAISHKIRGEGSYKLCPWVELYAGGSYVFAGQNVPRETDLHAGGIVKF